MCQFRVKLRQVWVSQSCMKVWGKGLPADEAELRATDPTERCPYDRILHATARAAKSATVDTTVSFL